MAPDASEPERGIDAVLVRMRASLDRLPEDDARRHFHSVYLRTTLAFREEMGHPSGTGFEDPAWVEAWDANFANLYLDQLDAWDRGEAAGAWNVPFRIARDRPGLHPLRHILFGVNVHVNFDLPRSLLHVITDEQFDDPTVLASRGRDHTHVDEVLASRVADEDRRLKGKSLLDRVLTPLNRRATRRFLKEAREKVWRNARVLSRARRVGPGELDRRIQELDRLCEARVADLVEPGQVVLKLARRGFGVLLEGA
jgi:hypothetical protein